MIIILKILSKCIFRKIQKHIWNCGFEAEEPRPEGWAESQDEMIDVVNLVYRVPCLEIIYLFTNLGKSWKDYTFTLKVLVHFQIKMSL